MNKERKYILVIGAAVLLAAAFYRFSPETESFFQGKNEILREQEKRARYREMLQEKDRLEAKLISARRELAMLEAGLLTGETPALAAVEIQNIVNEIAAQSQVEIQSMQILQHQTPGSDRESVYLSVPVQVNLTAGIRQLKEVLYKIENAPKLLKISSIRIRPHRRGRGQADMVQSHFTVEGFMKEKKNISEG